jgi:hypothetical protein
MKKSLYTIGIAAALLAVSCSIEENKLEQPSASQGTKLTLTGYTYPQTKVSIGEKDGDKYPLLWGDGDAIAIYSKDVTTTSGEDGDVITGTIAGEQAEVFSGSVGKSSGVFQTSNSFTVETDEDIVITYPAASLKYTDGKISGTLATMQEQRGANSSIHVGNNTFAFAETTLKAGQTEGTIFTLQQKTAFVKVILSTSEFSSLNLVGAKLYSPESQLSGKIEYDIASKQMTVTEAQNSVGVKFRSPVAFSGIQELYFTALPCNLTGKEVYLIVTMQDESRTVTIPAKINGGELKESCLSVIELSGISTSTNTFKWYDPVEVRDLVDAWAFGPQNTYYVGVEDNVEQTLKLDVKARGDISRISGAPKYYGLIAHSGQGGRKLLQLPGDVTAYQETPTNIVNDDYTIDVIVKAPYSSLGTYGVVAIYDENYKILWSYMICSYKKDDPIQEVAYPGTDYVLMDRALGAASGNAAGLAAKKLDNNVAYFQWGRKDPFGWSNSGLTHYNMKFPPEGADISTAIEHPYMVYGYTTGTDGDWQRKEHRTDLWGGVNNTTDWYDPNGVGHKTIYDPCPEGWRVPDARVLAEVQKNAEIWEVRLGKDLKYYSGTDESKYNPNQPNDRVNTDSPFYGNTSVLAYPLGNGAYDYWPYLGARFGDKENWGNRTVTNNVNGCCYWANSIEPTSKQGAMMEYCYFSTSSQHGARHNANRAQSFPIRCQKE